LVPHIKQNKPRYSGEDGTGPWRGGRTSAEAIWRSLREEGAEEKKSRLPKSKSNEMRSNKSSPETPERRIKGVCKLRWRKKSGKVCREQRVKK